MNDRSMFTCVIIDDEQIARYGLKSYVNKTPGLKCVEECKNIYDFEKYLENHQSPDILFIDIEMPEISGLDFISARTINSAIIIVTAYERYAIKGFELDVCDYLLKPVSYTRFRQAVDKAFQYIDYKKGKSSQDIMFIKSDRMMFKLHINDIIYLESLENYVKINTPYDRIIVRSTLKNLLSSMTSEMFLQIHKSYAVNLTRIKSIDKNIVVMDNNDELPLSRRLKKFLMERIDYINHHNKN